MFNMVGFFGIFKWDSACNSLCFNLKLDDTLVVCKSLLLDRTASLFYFELNRWYTYVYAINVVCVRRFSIEMFHG